MVGMDRLTAPVRRLAWGGGGWGEEVRLGCRVRTLPTVFALRREHYNEEDSKPVLVDARVDDGLGHRLGVRPRKLDCQQQANLCVCVCLHEHVVLRLPVFNCNSRGWVRQRTCVKL